ncbi:MAG: CBS and ACT domain-containing protein [Clostridia bacterium]|nr:CBS and ACT domain-containing protein [Clostridia bacterium]
MSSRPVTVSPETSVMDALELMKRNNVRRLPVMSGDTLAGIVTELDLLHISPSPATSLSVFEINYLISKMKVREAMTTKVLTVAADDTLEKAALMMRKHKIGGLPVLEGTRLVGIITETDIFDAFIEGFGLKHVGVRLTVDVADRRGAFAELTQAISSANADIISLSTFERAPGVARLVIRLRNENADKACEAVAAQGFTIVHKHAE